MIQSFGFLYILERNCNKYRTFTGLYSHIFLYIFIYSSVTFADDVGMCLVLPKGPEMAGGRHHPQTDMTINGCGEKNGNGVVGLRRWEMKKNRAESSQQGQER